jgi:hypothetical protein
VYEFYGNILRIVVVRLNPIVNVGRILDWSIVLVVTNNRTFLGK